MKLLHAIIAIVFVVIGLSIYTNTRKLEPSLLALLVANVSLAAIGIGNSLDKTPVETGRDDSSSG